LGNGSLKPRIIAAENQPAVFEAYMKSKRNAVKIAMIAMAWISLLSCCVSAQDPTQYGTPFDSVPDPRDVTMYQVNMRVFGAARNFAGVTARLDSIKALGVNVVYLMPVYPVGIVNSVNSPYCVRDYLAVNTEFGTLTDLRLLIDEAHKRTMAVILDWVANHTARDNAGITAHPSWYVHDGSGAIVSPNGWTDVAQLDFTNADMRTAMISAMRYWVFTVNCDGFRCDYADNPPIDFWQQAVRSLKSISTHQFIMMAEGGRSSNFTCFDYNFGFSFYEKMKTIFSQTQPATGLDTVNDASYSGAGAANQVVHYTTNHDVNSSDGTPLDLFGGRAGSMASFVVAAYMKGVPMVYGGQEKGTPYRLLFPFTGTTIDWTLNPDLTVEYAKILGLRKKCEALRRGSYLSFGSSDVCAFTRTQGTNQVFVLSNMRNASKSCTLPTTIANTSWVDAFTGSSVALKTAITLQSYEYRVLLNSPLAKALPGYNPQREAIARNGISFQSIRGGFVVSGIGEKVGIELYSLDGRKLAFVFSDGSGAVKIEGVVRRGVYVVHLIGSGNGTLLLQRISITQ